MSGYEDIVRNNIRRMECRLDCEDYSDFQKSIIRETIASYKHSLKTRKIMTKIHGEVHLYDVDFLV